MLTKLRKKKFPTQKAFGDRIGVHESFVYKIEANDGQPSEETLKRMCRVLGVKLEITPERSVTYPRKVTLTVKGK